MKVDPRFLTAQGAEIFTGNELLLKGALETEGGVHLLGGYPGSPVAGFFDSMAAIKDLLLEKGIRACISNNEALAAAMLNGLQSAACRGMIVMKSVGVHVAADALALANLAGAHQDGGAIVVYGDDPWSDSTQVPADSRYISKHLHIPTIEPATPQEVKDYVDMSFKLSRWSELYAGYVLTTNLADGGGTVACRPNQYPRISTNQRFELETAAINLDKRVLLPPRTWWQEENLADRFGRAIESARKLGFNQILHPQTTRRTIGFATSGMAHGYLVQALFEMGVLGQFPILKFGLSYPVDPELIRTFTEQCERIVVIEERRGFLEEQINEVILKDRQANKPSGKTEVWGKTFPARLKGIPDSRGLHPSILIARLVPLLKLINGSRTQLTVPDWADSLDREIETIDSTAQSTTELSGLPARSASFCPGCPHRETADVILEIQKRMKDRDYMRRKHGQDAVDLFVHGDTGCYTMLMFPPNASLMHDYSGMGLGGGTGAGIDPFITNKQAVFMGDSTFFHSGQIAISQAIKLGQDITFIILDNRTTGMTGHQPTPGVEYDILGNKTAVQDIEEIVRGIAGSSDVPVYRVDPTKRPEYMELMEKTLLGDGVKIIIADKECGITLMRRKRRAERAQARQLGYVKSWEHLNVNPDICRFCLACAEMTGCPGLKHTQTDYGRKMDTDVTWCVGDGACERIAQCTAFEYVRITRKRPPKSRVPELGLNNIPEPQKRSHEDLWRCCLVGVGGMGIGLATSIVVRAGHNEGYNVIFLDKKGLAIRNGGVISQVVYNISKQPITAVIPFGKADLLLGIDVLEAARVLDPRGRTRIASRERTAAVINTDKISTIAGLMAKEDFDPADLEPLIRSHTRSDDFLARDISRICEKYLGSKLYANIMMLGFAFQKGLIPVSMHSMAWAIKDTIRADFRKNLYAFNMGRKLFAQSDLFQGAPIRTEWRDMLEEKCRRTIRRYVGGRKIADQFRDLTATLIDKLASLEEPIKRALVVRLYDCMRWGGLEYARRYARNISSVYERDSGNYDFAATRAAIYALASHMLVQDAFFLAELSTSREKYHRDREKYAVNRANGDRIHYRHQWHVHARLLGHDIPLTLHPTDWMLKIFKRMRSLRKLLPGHARQQASLGAYERLIENFRYSTQHEYAQAVARLSGLECMNCLNARCQDDGCPLHNHIPGWMDLVYQGQWKRASDLLHASNNFPEFTSRICPAPCQDKCKQGINTFPVQIREIERQVVDTAFDQGWLLPQKARRASGRKVAVIGSGPSGLAAAQQLARAGHEVVVFEKDKEPGGLLRYGIPAFRLEKELIDRRLEQLRGEGVEFRCNTMVGRDVTGEQLREEFDAILIAAGATRPRDLNVPGRATGNIFFALDFLNAPHILSQKAESSSAGERQAVLAGAMEIKGKVVAVIGGGETGNDCVETALLRGAKAVHQFEILPASGSAGSPARTAADLGGTPQRDLVRALEKDSLIPDGANVHRRWSVATKEFIAGPQVAAGQDGHLRAIKAVQVQWQLTPKGKAMKEVPESDFVTPIDAAVLALGFDPIVEKSLVVELGLNVDAKGRAVIRDKATSAEGVFAAGDFATGPSLVAGAIGSGRDAAKKINDYLRRPVDDVSEPTPDAEALANLNDPL